MLVHNRGSIQDVTSSLDFWQVQHFFLIYRTNITKHFNGIVYILFNYFEEVGQLYTRLMGSDALM